MSIGPDRRRHTERGLLDIRAPVLAALAAGIGWSPGAAADGAVQEFGFGDWAGRAYFDDSGRYESCALYQASRLDSRLFLSLADGQLAIVLVNPSWDLPVGDEHPVTLLVDDLWIRKAVARIGAETGTGIDLGRDDEAIDALRRGRSLTIQMSERTFHFGLDGSSAAIALMQDCDERNGDPVGFAEGPRPASPDGGAPSNPFAPPDPAPSDIAPPDNPFAPAAPGSGEAAPSDVTVLPAGVPGGPRPAPARDGIQRITPYLPFSAFVLTVELFLPGEPEAWATPGDGLSDYQFQGKTEEGAYRGLYLEVAPLGETAAETLHRFMWVAETVCDGLSRSLGGLRERFGATEVAWETIECQTPGGPVMGSTVVSHTAESAQIFVIDGDSIAEVTAAAYRAVRGLARES